MRFIFFCALTTLAALLLALLTESCIPTNKRKREQPACLHGEANDGKCLPPPSNRELSDICLGEFGIKASGGSCVFHTAAFPQGCIVKGLYTNMLPTHGCVAVDSSGNSCTLDGLNRTTFLCTVAIPRNPAAVSVYLEVQEGGLKPHVVFDAGEKAQAGARLELREQTYRGQDITSGNDVDGNVMLSLDLKIPWCLEYTKEDGTQVCADGILDGSNNSKATAGRGNICLQQTCLQ